VSGVDACWLPADERAALRAEVEAAAVALDASRC
jgi:hypothetical protein